MQVERELSPMTRRRQEQADKRPYRAKRHERLISRRAAAEKRDLRIDWNTPFVSSSRRFMQDLFHTMVETPNLRLGLIFFGLYNLLLIVFAGVYHSVTVLDDCHTDFRTYTQTMFFSLQTMSSIGFGASDPYFNSCFVMYFLVSLQSFIGIVISAVAAGVVFARFARSQSRAASILFSKKATMSSSNGALRFQFRIADLRETALLEAKVRAYAIRNITDGTGLQYFYRATQMRLQYPDDGLGGMLMLAMPSLCASHDMSPIVKPNRVIKSPLVPPSVDDVNSLTYDQLTNYWQETNMEIVILVEGVVPSTSGSTQARWSYKIEDVIWQKEFVPCVDRYEDPSGKYCCKVDFSKFDEVQDISKPVEFN
jgi:hypothetical protein